MTKDQLIETLVKEGHVIQIGENDYEVSLNIRRLLSKPLTPEESFKKEEVIELPAPSVLLKKFIKDCKIPFRAKTSSGGFYQLAAESEYARRYLYNVLKQNKYNYEEMINVVGGYYNNPNMARVTLTRFFKEGLFDQIMEDFKSNPGMSITGAPKTNKVSL